MFDIGQDSGQSFVREIFNAFLANDEGKYYVAVSLFPRIFFTPKSYADAFAHKKVSKMTDSDATVRMSDAAFNFSSSLFGGLRFLLLHSDRTIRFTWTKNLKVDD